MSGGFFKDSDELTNALTEHIKAILAAERPTNGDRIREMTDEELADLLHSQFVIDNAYLPSDCWLAWLRAPAEDVVHEQQE